MIQKGIIESTISAYEYKVRIPRYDKLSVTPGSVSTNDLSSAIVCSTPGTKVSFSEGDIVLVGFENDELTKPVILGLLYRKEYGESDQFNSPAVQNALRNINKNLNELNSNKLYTHIKYSNNNKTFTSLYDIANVKTVNIAQSIYVEAQDIGINNKSSTIYWSVTDSNGIDVSNSLDIITTIYSSDIDYVKETHDTLINIPVNFMGCDNLKLSFRISKIFDFDNYNVVLTTDKDILGSIPGNYLGVCISNSSIAPIQFSQYSWIPLYNSIYDALYTMESDLVSRIERNEKSLYGYTYNEKSLQITDNTGILDGLSVKDNDVYLSNSILSNSYKNNSNQNIISLDNTNHKLIINL